MVPQCPRCSAQPPQSGDDNDDDHSQVLTIMKPDIVFFGEGLPDVFHHTLEQDKLSVSYCYVLVDLPIDRTQWQQMPFEKYKVSVKKNGFHFIAKSL